MLDILGSRKPVLFVEGTNGSYDTKLYSEIYSNYYVVPCGSCSNVIMQTKAMKANGQLHHLKAYGIIDRDFRVDYELNKLKDDGIYSLGVAEVENLFLAEELLQVVNNQMAKEDNTSVESVKNYIINDRFIKQLSGQVCEATVAQIKYKLATVDISKANENSAKDTLDKVFQSISYDSIREKVESEFNEIATSKNYKDVLKVFNCKALSNCIGNKFGINNDEYRDYVIRLLRSDKQNDVINALSSYLPTEIKR